MVARGIALGTGIAEAAGTPAEGIAEVAQDIALGIVETALAFAGGADLVDVAQGLGTVAEGTVVQLAQETLANNTDCAQV